MSSTQREVLNPSCVRSHHGEPSRVLWGGTNRASCALFKMVPRRRGWEGRRRAEGEKQRQRDCEFGQSSSGPSAGFPQAPFLLPPILKLLEGVPVGVGGNIGLCQFILARFPRRPGDTWRAQVTPHQRHSGLSRRCTLDTRASLSMEALALPLSTSRNQSLPFRSSSFGLEGSISPCV